MMQDIEKSEIYEQAKLFAEDNTEESLEKAMQMFRSIQGWQDSGKQYVSCRTRLGRMRWERESAIIKEYEDRHEEQMKRQRRTGLIILAAVLLIIALIVTITLVRFYRYNMAEARYCVGDYERSAEAFMKMGDYKDSRAMVYNSAVGMYRQKMYEEALPYFVWLDGYLDHGYYLQKCREKLGIDQ